MKIYKSLNDGDEVLVINNQVFTLKDNTRLGWSSLINEDDYTEIEINGSHKETLGYKLMTSDLKTEIIKMELDIISKLESKKIYECILKELEK